MHDHSKILCGSTGRRHTAHQHLQARRPPTRGAEERAIVGIERLCFQQDWAVVPAKRATVAVALAEGDSARVTNSECAGSADSTDSALEGTGLMMEAEVSEERTCERRVSGGVAIGD